MPPHLGHQYLIDFALSYVSELVVLVCSLENDPIAGELRYQWVKKMFPNVEVIHQSVDIPQEPSEHPNFWEIWRESIGKHVPGKIDYVFASEQYGWKLADILGAKYVPVDHVREIMPVSGSKVREDPLACWHFIPAVVRPYFLKRICIFGPESTGKSTLTRDLALRYNTSFVSEYARGLLDHKNGRCDYEDIDLIARGQLASESSMEQHANRVLFCDTDIVTTAIWSEVLFEKCPEWIVLESLKKRYDLYLLLDIDVPWVEDNQRCLAHRREEFFKRCEQALIARNFPFVRIYGNWQERFNSACQAVDSVLGSNVAMHDEGVRKTSA